MLELTWLAGSDEVSAGGAGGVLEVGAEEIGAPMNGTDCVISEEVDTASPFADEVAETVEVVDAVADEGGRVEVDVEVLRVSSDSSNVTREDEAVVDAVLELLCVDSGRSRVKSGDEEAVVEAVLELLCVDSDGSRVDSLDDEAVVEAVLELLCVDSGGSRVDSLDDEAVVEAGPEALPPLPSVVVSFAGSFTNALDVLGDSEDGGGVSVLERMAGTNVVDNFGRRVIVKKGTPLRFEKVNGRKLLVMTDGTNGTTAVSNDGTSGGASEVGVAELEVVAGGAFEVGAAELEVVESSIVDIFILRKLRTVSEGLKAVGVGLLTVLVHE